MTVIVTPHLPLPAPHGTRHSSITGSKADPRRIGVPPADPTTVKRMAHAAGSFFGAIGQGIADIASGLGHLDPRTARTGGLGGLGHSPMRHDPPRRGHGNLAPHQRSVDPGFTRPGIDTSHDHMTVNVQKSGVTAL
jgi:hypothetical protein